jgi:transcriptional regulator with XRE-family HTH domain
MHDIRLGTAIRLLRQRRRWTQAELGARAGVSDTTISRIERGHIRSLTVGTIQDVAGELDVRIDLVPRWRSGDLDRLLNRRHSTLHELVARWFGEVLPDWVLAPEVSYSIYGERGVIDILAWHPGRRALLIIELKTDIVV